MKKSDMESLTKARQDINTEYKKFAKAAGQLLEPLKKIDDKQVAALATFGYLTRAIHLANRPSLSIDSGTLKQFTDLVDQICPPLGEVSIAKDPCFEASVAYASALVSCRNDDPPRDEDECFEAWGNGAQAVMCAMQDIENMKGVIGGFLGGIRPPQPFPWPE